MNRLRNAKIVRLALAVNARYGQDGGGHLAASLTYFGFLSLFPLLLLAMSVVGFLLAGDVSAQREWADRLSGSVPGLGPLIGENIEALVESRRGAGVIGFVGLIWSGTGLTNAASYALSKILRREQVQGLICSKLWSLGVTIGLGLVALAGTALSATVAGITATGAAGLGLAAAAFIVSLVLDVSLFLVAYRVLTSSHGPDLTSLWRGALLSGAGWTVLKVAGGWYATRTVADASEVYGTFGSVVGLLALLYLGSRLFMYSAELIAVLEEDGPERPAA